MIEAIIIGGAVVLFAIMLTWAWRGERRRFNGGWCPECQNPWRYFDTDSQGGRGYKCDPCKTTIWISYPGIDQTNKEEN